MCKAEIENYFIFLVSSAKSRKFSELIQAFLSVTGAGVFTFCAARENYLKSLLICHSSIFNTNTYIYKMQAHKIQKTRDFSSKEYNVISLLKIVGHFKH